MTKLITGVFRDANVKRFLAIASLWPLSSAPIPGKAPGVSIIVIIGILNYKLNLIYQLHY